MHASAQKMARPPFPSVEPATCSSGVFAPAFLAHASNPHGCVVSEAAGRWPGGDHVMAVVEADEGTMSQMQGAPMDAEQLFEHVIALSRDAGDRVIIRDERHGVSGSDFADGLASLRTALEREGLRQGQQVLVGLKPEAELVMVLLAVLSTGAQVELIDPAAHESPGEARPGSEPEPDWVIADSLLYLAAARTPLRGYLRRRGFVVPTLGGPQTVRVRAGRRYPFVPRSHSLASMISSEQGVSLDAAGLSSREPHAALVRIVERFVELLQAETVMGPPELLDLRRVLDRVEPPAPDAP
jgi:hypothetical protein